MIALSELVGQPLLPWQVHALTEGTRVRPDGRFASRTVGITVARQNGKSHLMRMLILTHLFIWDTQRIVSMAQNRALAVDQFKQAVDIVMRTPELRAMVKGNPRFANGQESLQLKNGARWEIVAATQEGPRGRTADLLWIDELREIDEKAWKAATPITRARKNAQVWVTSNAGDAHSTVLNDLRTGALAGAAKGVCWLEWSADPAKHISDRSGWYQANPALGHLIDEDAIESASRLDKPEAFRTESLCLWVDSLDSPWPYGKWDECRDADLKVDPGQPTWLAIDVTPDRTRADLVAGQVLEDGRIAVAVVESWESNFAIDDLKVASEVAKWSRTYGTALVAFDRWTGANIAQRLQVGGIPVQDVSGQLFSQACDETLSAMNSLRIVHVGQPILDTHMNACARKGYSDGGWRIVRKDSGGPISAAVAAVMVVHLASKPQAQSDIIFV